MDVKDLSKIQYEEIIENLGKRISIEDSLIADRMGWLVSANAFLLTPIAIMLGTDGLTETESYYAAILCVLGLSLSRIVGSTIDMAVDTIKVLVSRRRHLMDTVIASKDSVLVKWTDPSTRLAETPDLGPRKQETHERSMGLQSGIPWVVFYAWCMISLFVACELYAEITDTINLFCLPFENAQSHDCTL